MDKRNDFATILKNLIATTDMPPNILAKQINFEPSSIYKWLNGGRIPSAKNADIVISEIAQAFAAELCKSIVIEESFSHMLDKLGITPDPECLENSAGKLKDRPAAPYARGERGYTVLLVQILTDAYQTSKEEMMDDREKDIGLGSGVKQGRQEEGSFIDPDRLEDRIMELLECIADIQAQEQTKIFYIIHDPLVPFRILEKLSTEKEDLLRRLLDSGWTLCVLLCVDRYYHNLLSITRRLLRLTGSMSNFEWRYTFTDNARTLLGNILVMGKKCAVISFPSGNSHTEYAMSVDNPRMLEGLFQFYNERIPNFKPLFSPYSCADLYNSDKLVSGLASGGKHLVSSKVDVDFLSEELFQSLKDKLAMDPTGKLRDSTPIIKSMEAEYRVYGYWSQKKYNHIIPGRELIRYAESGELEICGHTYKFTAKQRIRHFNLIMDCIANNSGFNLMVTEEEEMDEIFSLLNLKISENNHVILKVSGSLFPVRGQTPAEYLVLDEPLFVETLEKIFFGLWERARAESRDKDRLTRLFSGLVSWLSDQK